MNLKVILGTLGGITVIFIVLIVCHNINKQEDTADLSSTVPTPALDNVIEMPLLALIDSLKTPGRETRYVGKTMRITGRFRGIIDLDSGDFGLKLKDNASFDDLICSGLPNHYFLNSVHEGNIVRITGILKRKPSVVIGDYWELENCTEGEKIK